MFNKGKTKLKCFNEISYNGKSTNLEKLNGQFCSSNKKSTVEVGENDSILCKTNCDIYSFVDETNSSQEKSTMTDPHIARKSKDNDTSSSNGDFLNIKSILKSISENKADSKVPIVVLSKSPEETLSDCPPLLNNQQMNKSNEEKEKGFIEKIMSVEENFKSLSTSKNINNFKANISPLSTGSAIPFSDDGNTTDEESSNLIYSHEFTGFTPVKCQNLESSGIRKIENNTKQKEDLSTEITESNQNVNKDESSSTTDSLDHSYSHSKLKNGQKKEVQDKEYNYQSVSRSLFGTPSSSKSLPDIMLHNDKINLLRQMSQVFNDEKSKPEPVKTKLNVAPPPDEDTSSSNSMKNNWLNWNTDSSLDDGGKKYKDLSEFRKEANNKTENNSLNNSNITFLPESDKKGEQVSIGQSNSVSFDLKNAEGEVDLVQKSNLPKEKYNDFTAPVHLVSSYSLDKSESINVKSSKGVQGEHIDVIDGFTFASFLTEKDMKNYKPKIKKKKVKRKGKWKTIVCSKPVEKVYMTEGINTPTKQGETGKSFEASPKDKIVIDQPDSVLERHKKCDEFIESASSSLNRQEDNMPLEGPLQKKIKLTELEKSDCNDGAFARYF